MGLTRTWGARGSPCCLAEPGFPPLWGAVLGPPEWSPLCLLPLSLPALLLLLPAGSLHLSTGSWFPPTAPFLCSGPASAQCLSLPHIYIPQEKTSAEALWIFWPQAPG